MPMAFLIALLALGGWAFGGTKGLLSFAALGLVLNFGIYWFSDRLALMAHRARRPYEFAGPATAHLFIVNPLRGGAARILNMFSTHPPSEARIARLREMPV